MSQPKHRRAWRELLRTTMRRTGVELSRYPVESSALHRRGRLLRHFCIDLVVDVGANEGQFGRELREALGFQGRIVSFEPLYQACENLRRIAERSPPWEVHHTALGHRCGHDTLMVAGNAESSSLLPMLPAHEAAEPKAGAVGQQRVAITTLDALWPSLRQGAKHVWLKIDTQGFEAQVLNGADAALQDIATVQLELSLVPLYAGAASADALHLWLLGRGYRLVGLEPGFCDFASGVLLQADGIYHRECQR